MPVSFSTQMLQCRLKNIDEKVPHPSLDLPGILKEIHNLDSRFLTRYPILLLFLLEDFLFLTVTYSLTATDIHICIISRFLSVLDPKVYRNSSDAELGVFCISPKMVHFTS